MTSSPPAATVREPEALQLAHTLYGVQGTARRLPGEWDDNFLLTVLDGTALVLKVSHPSESLDALELQVAALGHLAREAPGLAVPVVLPTLDWIVTPHDLRCDGDDSLCPVATLRPWSTHGAHGAIFCGTHP